MDKTIDTKRIGIFLAFAFGTAWIVALVIYLTGGLYNSPEIIPGSGITLVLILLAVGYMGAPTLAHILTRLITREGWRNTTLRPNFRRGWRYLILAWVSPAILTILGATFFFFLMPQYFDPELTWLKGMSPSVDGQPMMDPWLVVALYTLQGVLIAPLINGLFTFGEEFGWRGYLQPRLMPLGGRRTMLIMGVIWGVWHAPIIAMGHNFGMEYPGAPWTGILAMTWFTLVTGTFLGWATLRGGSVWPAVIGHAAINGIAALGALAVKGDPNPLLGPLPVGVIASIAWTLAALWIFLNPSELRTPEAQPQIVPPS